MIRRTPLLIPTRPYLVLAVLALVISGPGIIPGRAFAPSGYLFGGAESGRTSLQWDVALQAHPWLLHESRELRRGRIPLWNPWSLCGAPFLGNIQTAALSPFTLSAAVLPLPFGIAFAAWLKLFVAGAGMLAWLRLLGLGPVAALAGAVPFMLNGFLAASLRWQHSGAAVWLPWLLFSIEIIRRSPGIGASGLLASVVALQFFGGHPPTSVHLAAAAAAYVLVRLPSSGRFRFTLCTIGGAVGGGLIAAPVILPFIDFLSRSVVWEARRVGFGGCLTLREVIAWVLPDYHGSPVRPPVWHPAGANPYDSAASPGMAVWTLATAGWLAATVPLRGIARFLVVTAVAGAALAVGVPWIHPLLTSVPPFSMLNGVRGGLLTAFAACALAAFAVHALAVGASRGASARATVRWTAGALVTAVACLVWFDAHEISSGGGWGTAGTAAALGACIAAGTAMAAGLGKARALALILCMIPDLLRFGLRWNETSPAASFYPETPAIRLLRQHPHDRASLSTVNLGTAYGVREAGGFDSMTPALIRNLLGDDETGGAAGTGPLIPVRPPGHAALRSAAVRRYVIPAGVRPLSRGFIPTAAGAETVIQDRGAPGRARLDGSGRIRFVVDDPERVVLLVETASADHLTLADTWDPGWAAWVNGHRVRIRTVDRAFRSVPLPPGQAIVRFAYDPLPWRAGLWLAGLALGCLAGAACRRRAV